MNFGANSAPPCEPSDIPGAVEDLELPVGVEEPGIAGMDPAVRALRGGGRLGVLVIALERARALEQHLAVLGDADFDAVDRRADGVGLHRAILLDAQEHRALGHAVELLQIDPERAVEGEEVGSDRLARGIGEADAAEAQSILERPVDQRFTEPIEHPFGQRHAMPVEYRRPDALGEIEEKMKEPALRPAGILHADHDLGQDALEDPRRRKEIGRPELAQVEHDRRLRFRAGGAKAGAIGLRVGEDVLADPRHRQIGQHLLAIAQAFERDRAFARW